MVPFFTDSGQFFWDDPRKVGVEVKDADGSTYFRGPGAGTAVYLTHLRAKSRDFIKGGDAIFLLTMEGNQIIPSLYMHNIYSRYSIYIYTLSHLLALFRRLSSSTQPASPNDQHPSYT